MDVQTFESRYNVDTKTFLSTSITVHVNILRKRKYRFLSVIVQPITNNDVSRNRQTGFRPSDNLRKKADTDPIGKSRGCSVRTNRPPWNSCPKPVKMVAPRRASTSTSRTETAGCRLQDLCAEDRSKLARLVYELAVAQQAQEAGDSEPNAKDFALDEVKKDETVKQEVNVSRQSVQSILPEMQQCTKTVACNYGELAQSFTVISNYFLRFYTVCPNERKRISEMASDSFFCLPECHLLSVGYQRQIPDTSAKSFEASHTYSVSDDNFLDAFWVRHRQPAFGQYWVMIDCWVQSFDQSDLGLMPDRQASRTFGQSCAENYRVELSRIEDELKQLRCRLPRDIQPTSKPVLQVKCEVSEAAVQPVRGSSFERSSHVSVQCRTSVSNFAPVRRISSGTWEEFSHMAGIINEMDQFSRDVLIVLEGAHPVASKAVQAYEQLTGLSDRIKPQVTDSTKHDQEEFMRVMYTSSASSMFIRVRVPCAEETNRTAARSKIVNRLQKVDTRRSFVHLLNVEHHFTIGRVVIGRVGFSVNDERPDNLLLTNVPVAPNDPMTSRLSQHQQTWHTYTSTLLPPEESSKGAFNPCTRALCGKYDISPENGRLNQEQPRLYCSRARICDSDFGTQTEVDINNTNRTNLNLIALDTPHQIRIRSHTPLNRLLLNLHPQIGGMLLRIRQSLKIVHCLSLEGGSRYRRVRSSNIRTYGNETVSKFMSNTADRPLVVILHYLWRDFEIKVSLVVGLSAELERHLEEVSLPTEMTSSVRFCEACSVRQWIAKSSHFSQITEVLDDTCNFGICVNQMSAIVGSEASMSTDVAVFDDVDVNCIISRTFLEHSPSFLSASFKLVLTRLPYRRNVTIIIRLEDCKALTTYPLVARINASVSYAFGEFSYTNVNESLRKPKKPKQTRSRLRSGDSSVTLTDKKIKQTNLVDEKSSWRVPTAYELKVEQCERCRRLNFRGLIMNFGFRNRVFKLLNEYAVSSVLLYYTLLPSNFTTRFRPKDESPPPDCAIHNELVHFSRLRGLLKTFLLRTGRS
ncbi:hypothetical protein CLF_100410 [Clonorchis sinensis]|uniref:Uncharacterized protein n=1 Tax=Clonorchis sinensis TaxID=79923 RepID=G7Y3D8_CLOSI|nr:hypothetical protein CLF_100410 [Clonorchis sinensis]